MEMFVVRVWRAADWESAGIDNPPARLRGLAEHVGTGATERFRDNEELLRFLRRTSTLSHPGEPAVDPGCPEDARIQITDAEKADDAARG